MSTVASEPVLVPSAQAGPAGWLATVVPALLSVAPAYALTVRCSAHAVGEVGRRRRPRSCSGSCRRRCSATLTAFSNQVAPERGAPRSRARRKGLGPGRRLDVRAGSSRPRPSSALNLVVVWSRFRPVPGRGARERVDQEWTHGKPANALDVHRGSSRPRPRSLSAGPCDEGAATVSVVVQMAALALSAVAAIGKARSTATCPWRRDSSWRAEPVQAVVVFRAGGGVALSIFMYRGWAAALSACEERRAANARRGSPRCPPLILAITYAVVAVAAQCKRASAGRGSGSQPGERGGRVRRAGRRRPRRRASGLALFPAVLASSASSLETMFIPGRRRARDELLQGAARLAVKIHPTHGIPSYATLVLAGTRSSTRYGPASENVLVETILSLGLDDLLLLRADRVRGHLVLPERGPQGLKSFCSRASRALAGSDPRCSSGC